jgi:hypothetical protein
MRCVPIVPEVNYQSPAALLGVGFENRGLLNKYTAIAAGTFCPIERCGLLAMH